MKNLIELNKQLIELRSILRTIGLELMSAEKVLEDFVAEEKEEKKAPRNRHKLPTSGKRLSVKESQYLVDELKELRKKFEVEDLSRSSGITVRNIYYYLSSPKNYRFLLSSKNVEKLKTFIAVCKEAQNELYKSNYQTVNG